MHYDAIIFDIDGTLWNTVAPCTEGWNKALRKLGGETALEALILGILMSILEEGVLATFLTLFLEGAAAEANEDLNPATTLKW